MSLPSSHRATHQRSYYPFSTPKPKSFLYEVFFNKEAVHEGVEYVKRGMKRVTDTPFIWLGPFIFMAGAYFTIYFRQDYFKRLRKDPSIRKVAS